MAPRRERFQRLKDALEAHRGMIVYTIVALALMGAAVGWGLLPDMVSMAPKWRTPISCPRSGCCCSILAWRRAFPACSGSGPGR